MGNMGCGTSSQGNRNEDRHEQDVTNKKVEDELKKEKERRKREIKLLLLGAGESGKSTISKQMKIIYLNGFTQEEKNGYKPIVHFNIMDSIKILCVAAHRYGYEFAEENKASAKFFSLINVFETEFVPALSTQVQSLWQDPAIVKSWERRNELQITDAAQYFFENLDRISEPTYVPDESDCLRCHARTTGIIETEFEFQKLIYRIVDVGGQRSERKKWIHCFDNVTAVLFCVSLSEYDQRLYEDTSVNRMQEALSLFEQTCQTKWFKNTSLILFLNKRDLFEEKISRKDLKICFSDYQGGPDVETAIAFIEQKFQQRNKTNKKVYSHITTATNTESVQFVFSAISDMIISQRLANANF